MPPLASILLSLPPLVLTLLCTGYYIRIAQGDAAEDEEDMKVEEAPAPAAPTQASNKRKSSTSKSSQGNYTGGNNSGGDGGDGKDGPNSEEEDKEQEYTVKQLVDRRSRKGALQYLVEWDGFDEAHNTWEPAENLPQEFITKYENPPLSDYEEDRLANIARNQAFLERCLAVSSDEEEEGGGTQEAGEYSGAAAEQTGNIFICMHSSRVCVGVCACAEHPCAYRPRSCTCTRCCLCRATT